MAYRSIGAVKKNGGSGNLASVGLPSGHVAGDILVLVLSAADNVVCSVDQSYTNKLATNNGTSCRQEVWWKRDTGSEVAPTITHTAGNSASAFILAFSGETGAGDPFSAAAAQGNLGSATVTAPTITPNGNEDVIFVGTACSNTNTTGAPITQASYSGTNPTFTERGDSEESTGSKEAAIAVATGISNGTATGSRTSATTSGFTAAEIDNVGALLSLTLAASGSYGIIRIPNPNVGPMALRHRMMAQNRYRPTPPATGAIQVLSGGASLLFTEAVTLVKTAVLGPADNITFSESATLVKIAQIAESDNITFAEAVTLVKIAVLSPSDTIRFSEAVTLVATKVLVPSTNITFSEATTLVATKVIAPVANITFSVTTNLVRVASSATTKIAQSFYPVIAYIMGKWR